MCAHTIKLSHIASSQQNKFSFYCELEHFKSHVMPKNVEFSESLVLTTRISKYWNLKNCSNNSAWDKMSSTSHFWL